MSRILIVGGGMAGASLALLLARRTKHDIVLVEQAPLTGGPFPDTPSYDARSTALALGSAEILDALGVWAVLAAHAQPITRIGISHCGRFGSARLEAADEGVAMLGFVAENRHIGHALVAALRNTRVTIRSPMKVAAVARDGAAHRVVLADGESLTADLLVVADGVNSSLRQTLGIAVHSHEYGATALVCNLSTREPHAGMAFERFTDDGAVALLPLVGETSGNRAEDSRRLALVWSVPDARARELLALDERDFIAALDAATGGRLGGVAKTGVRHAYPLVKTVAAEQAVPGAVLVGNAAHLLHPVAGQGFNLTLRDLAALADTLAQAERDGEPVGELRVLQRYVDSRARDQQLTAGLSHRLPQLFGAGNPLLSAGRDFGLFAFDVLAPLKREFARQTMGVGVFTGGVSRAG
ncbi:MAG: 2-octaprenyl-6-methoxyphenyl hydroxylase [Pseudomonadota bacterium]